MRNVCCARDRLPCGKNVLALMVAVARTLPSRGRANWFADREIRGRAGVSSASLRLVTFDRRHRRLGALLEGKVVDLPALVGHPAFPETMERLVRSSRGTVLDAARAALERDEADAFVVDRPRLLAALLPASLRSADAAEGRGPCSDPGDDPVARGRRMARVPPKIAAVLRRPVGDALDPEERLRRLRLHAGRRLARAGASGDPISTPAGVPIDRPLRGHDRRDRPGPRSSRSAWTARNG